MINNLLRYLDLQSEKRLLSLTAKDKNRKSVSLPVIPQYIVLVLGITLQPYLVAFQENHNWNLQGLAGWLIFALITAVTIFPIVYKKTFDPNSSLFVQLCTIFSAGVGWQSLFAIVVHKSSTNP
jgi:membrane protein YdbS with pleckstrin-like domain